MKKSFLMTISLIGSLSLSAMNDDKSNGQAAQKSILTTFPSSISQIAPKNSSLGSAKIAPQPKPRYEIIEVIHYSTAEALRLNPAPIAEYERGRTASYDAADAAKAFN